MGAEQSNERPPLPSCVDRDDATVFGESNDAETLWLDLFTTGRAVFAARAKMLASNDSIRAFENKHVPRSSSEELVIYRFKEKTPDTSLSSALEELDALDVLSSEIRKKLFRHLAIHCHPDKTSDPSRHLLFRRGRHAEETNQQILLVSCVARLALNGVPLPLSAEERQSLRTFEQHALQKLGLYRSTLGYKWHSMTEEQKERNL